jgi:ABC-type polysaccharide/polyol phosphate transport system ATPase subunit
MVDLLVESVSKRYRIQSDSESKGRFGFGKTRFKDFWAIRDLSFEVRRGESLGIIGHNGAGKSTILKLLSNITAPTQGKITINGRISALLEVGSGFHPELSGRENVYLSGSILGMSRGEISAKFESIVEFAGIRQFIDLPVKRYSSGMYVRLGFAVAAHLDPDILLLDEVLAVGDRAFQDKCKDRIAELHAQGMTMIFISHDMTAVRNLCGRVILLQRGEILAEGTPDSIIRQYTETASFHQSSRTPGSHKIVQVTNVEFFDERGERSTMAYTGRPLSCRVEYLVHSPIPDGAVAVYFMGADGNARAVFSTSVDGAEINMRPGPAAVEFSCDELGLQPGVYQIDVDIEHAGTHQNIEWQHGCASIAVEPAKHIRGDFYMPHRWRHEVKRDST